MKSNKDKFRFLSSIIGLVFGTILIIVGILIIIPLLEIYGVVWTFCALSVVLYNAYNIFGAKNISFWEED